MQGGSASGAALTAYVAISLIEVYLKLPFHLPFFKYLIFQTQLAGYTAQINNALGFLFSHITTLFDPYTLAIVAYAFQLADHPGKSIALQLLNNQAITTCEYSLKPTIFWRLIKKL